MFTDRFCRFETTSHWIIGARAEEIAAVLDDVEGLPRWWPEVYRATRLLAPGDPETGLGREFSALTLGRLPYSLRWSGRTVFAEPPGRWIIAVSGDLEGEGVWRLEENGRFTEVIFDWRVDLRAPLARVLSPVLRPAYLANLRWAMTRGLEGLGGEARRRRLAELDGARLPPLSAAG